ncbi:hypothetical protein ACP4OV_027001 [Aristida adscensionis]
MPGIFSCLIPNLRSSSSSGSATCDQTTAPQPQPKTTTSTVSSCTPRTVRGTHVFEIDGYSLHKGVGAGNYISSVAFDVGGYTWRICYYPDGDGREGSGGFISVFLVLLSKNVEVRAFYELRIINLITGSSSPIFRSAPRVFAANPASASGRTGWGTSKFMNVSDLEASPAFLRNDRLAIECNITVLREPQVVGIAASRAYLAEVPPPDMSDDLAKLLETKEGADVTFMVEGEVFTAHAMVLAMRSSVFKAELFGPYKEHKRQAHITIEDMQPIVFRGLLHFI